MSIGTILLIILVIVLLGGFSGYGGGPFYGTGYYGGGGLGLIIVNALILYLLPIVADHIDFLHGSIIIQNIPALLFTTIIVSVINFIIHLAL